jgi:endonuclease-8
MTGSWAVSRAGRRWGRRAWIVLRAGGQEVAELDGPLLELMTDGRTRFDQRLSQLGPDVLAPAFDQARFIRLLRADDPTRPIGDALLDQRNLAGIGNIWKAEGCWEVGLDPWRPAGTVPDERAAALIEAVRLRMLESALHGPRAIESRVYRRAGRPCPRCGTRIAAAPGGWGGSPSGNAKTGPAPRHPPGESNRTTYWCPGCQS